MELTKFLGNFKYGFIAKRNKNQKLVDKKIKSRV